jgi:hypothetical protein
MESRCTLPFTRFMRTGVQGSSDEKNNIFITYLYYCRGNNIYITYPGHITSSPSNMSEVIHTNITSVFLKGVVRKG